MTETVCAEEKAARDVAGKFFADKKCAGARIIRNWLRADGRMVETEVACQTRTIRDDGVIHLAPIESAPPRCESQQAYYAHESRDIINRLFRVYLDRVHLTPTELLHTFREIKRLQNKDLLVPSAADRVAYLQTRDGGKQDSKARRDEILTSVEGLANRARQADGRVLPKLTGTFGAMMAAIENAPTPDDRDFLALVVLTRDLAAARSWGGKMERLCRLALEETDAHALDLLDGAMADLLSTDVVQEILGWQPGLGAAICRMADLADGAMPIEKSDARELADPLNRLLSQGKLPTCRAVLVDRIHRQIRSPNPLYRSDSTREMTEFNRLLERMVTLTGFYQGVETATALTIRYGRLVEQGGAAGRRAAIAGLFCAMPDRALGVIYLCELARSEFAAEHAPDMAEQFDQVVSTQTLAQFCHRALTPKDRLHRATAAHAAILASPYVRDMRERIAGHIDSLLETYLVEEQIIERLDHPGSPLRERATRLVQFCSAGLLPQGRALNRARERILALLRQPNFDVHFVDGIDSADMAQKILRDFYQVLLKAGFRP